MKKVLIVSSLIILGSLLLTCGIVRADRGSMPLRPPTMKENINVFDAGQKAIICWNGGQELMILSTDKYATSNSKVLEFMPLPSKPSRVEESKDPSFEGIAKLITAHRPAMPSAKMETSLRSAGAGKAASQEQPAVVIVFHEKIGAHDISIAQVQRLDGFTDWAKKFYTRNQVEYNAKDVARLHPLVADYMNRGFTYFVFDVIELTREKQSIEPILYKFASRDLYFPLKVTTLAEGETDISLYLFTNFRTDIWATRTGFKSGFYSVSGQVSYQHPIKFEVTSSEMMQVSKEIARFMKADDYGDEKVWFSTAKYKGSTKNLTKDFIMKTK
ncbi:MAG: DUF2330 domain-containing protein [Candidatus Xenobiia bacterium LiM19]